MGKRVNHRHSNVWAFNKSALMIISGLILVGLTGCFSEKAKTGGRKSGGGIDNSPGSVSSHYGRLLNDNPIILSGNANLTQDVDLSTLLVDSQEFITSNQFLINPCSVNGTTISECYKVKQDNLSNFISANSNTWAFDANSGSFLQVNTFGHIKRLTTDFHTKLSWMYDQANPGVLESYKTALPFSLFDGTYNAFWFGTDRSLIAYSDCGVENNAFFSAATTSLCFGYDNLYTKVKFAQDPPVIYHELGHGFNEVLLNVRNQVDPSITTTTDLGYLFYDEAGSIGEGVCDYWSYTMNQRPHFAEWALGRFLNASRPMTEDDALHAPGISTDEDSRLAYPTYLLYDPNDPKTTIEDVHYAGQIISHYLVALTGDFITYCSMSRSEAVRAVTQLMVETFAELGTQTGSANDNMAEGANLIAGHGIEWISKARGINFRNWAQAMARNMYNIYSNGVLNRCNGSVFPKDRIEQLLDQYGLLLFKTYNRDGNGATTGNAFTKVEVESINRVRTVMIPKDLLKLDPTENAPSAFVFDNPSDMRSALQGMQSTGQIGSLSSQIESGLPYNNGNGRISPGEFVGISLNLYNDSNSTMAGVHVLGNDWDHAKNGKPCNTFDDNWPLLSEGAADTTGESGGNPGECKYITRKNGDETEEDLAPVCYVQINDSNASKWAMQDQLMTQISLDPSLCLGGENDTQDCFIRAVKGADHAFYVRIDPKTTFSKSVPDENGAARFNSNNVIFFEVSPWIPPGTTFDCRFRARFSNCDDCWTEENTGSNSFKDNDDFLDYEFSGAKPFKIIHFRFNVVD